MQTNILTLKSAVFFRQLQDMHLKIYQHQYLLLKTFYNITSHYFTIVNLVSLTLLIYIIQFILVIGTVYVALLSCFLHY